MAKATQEELRMSTLHPRLQTVFTALVGECAADLTRPYLVSGNRTQGQQDDCVKRKASTVLWPSSAHNQLPSLAMDVQALNIGTGKLIDGDAAVRLCCVYACHIYKIAGDLGFPIRWGGLWQNSWPRGLSVDEVFDEIVHRNMMRKNGRKTTPEGESTWCDTPHVELPDLWDAIKGDKKALLAGATTKRKW